MRVEPPPCCGQGGGGVLGSWLITARAGERVADILSGGCSFCTTHSDSHCARAKRGTTFIIDEPHVTSYLCWLCGSRVRETVVTAFILIFWQFDHVETMGTVDGFTNLSENSRMKPTNMSFFNIVFPSSWLREFPLVSPMRHVQFLFRKQTEVCVCVCVPLFIFNKWPSFFILVCPCDNYSSETIESFFTIFCLASSRRVNWNNWDNPAAAVKLTFLKSTTGISVK